MAKSSKVETCIFCGEVPCECNKPKVQAKKRVTKKPAVKDKPSPFVGSKPKEPERDLIMEAAIKACEPILSANEKLYYQRLLHPPLPPGVEKRLQDWKNRNVG